jgi:hypothetical protein
LDKPACIQEYIADNSIDLLALTETWIQPDFPPSTLQSLTPQNYSIINCPRSVGRGGGIALIYNSSLKVNSLSLASYSSFELLGVKFSVSYSSCICCIIYRPPSSSLSVFFDEFSSLLAELSSSTSELLFCGDFNIHVDDSQSNSALSFLNLLESFGLQQHVNFLTHSSNHTLDLLISRPNSNLVGPCDFVDPSLSDHVAVHTKLSFSTPNRPAYRKVEFRKFSSIDVAQFSHDILSSDLYKEPPFTLSDYLKTFNSTLTHLLDKHAPVKRVCRSSKIAKPYITADIRSAKSLRSKLETVYWKSKSQVDRDKFKVQSRLVTKLISASKRSYYRNLISQSKVNPRRLWSSLNSVLHRSSGVTQPSCSSSSQLASSFLSFFSDKIIKLTSQLRPDSLSPHVPPPFAPPILSEFSTVSQAEVRKAILSSSNSTCMLDIIPTSLVKSCLDALLPAITTLLNLSISESTVPDDFKTAIVTPLIKKHSLPKDDLSSYRPISNLNFLSKILERVIYNRLLLHLELFPSFSSFQSAYRKHHSVETALLRIQNDLLLAADRKHISALVLLDLSAAFDTVDHEILLQRLSLNFGIQNSALNFLRSYLIGRSQCIKIDSNLSDKVGITTGVPQGSVLGPLLFSLYTTPLTYQLDASNLSYHLYADDTQLYVSFGAKDCSQALSILSNTLDSVHAWLSRNYLSLNPSKTEFLIIGTTQQRAKLTLKSFSFSGNSIVSSSSVRNLGVIFEEDLSLNKQITQVCKSCHYLIRQFRTIRPLLDHDSAVLLANALVSTRLDFCNSLYSGLPKKSLNQLQLVQNSLARFIYSSRKFDRVTPLLHQLHWLPVEQRISYKVALLTFKTLQTNSPKYLSDFLVQYKPMRSLRSDRENYLVVPRVCSVAGRRSFSYVAPTLWNSLPSSVRHASSLSSFRSQLKTYLYPP